MVKFPGLRRPAVPSTPSIVCRGSPTLAVVAILSTLGACSTSISRPADTPIAVRVYKLETCGCCRPYVRYLEREGFRVDVVDVLDLGPIRAARGIPEELASCHTSEVNGKLVEGHVPAEDIRRLLRDRRPIDLLSVPGMPAGPPGMHDDEAAGPYSVVARFKDGHTETYASHPPYGSDATAAPASPHPAHATAVP